MGNSLITMFFNHNQLRRPLRWSLFLCLLAFNCTAQQFDWAQSIGGLGLDVGRAVTTDEDGNVFVAGNFTGSTHIADTFVTGYGSMEAFVAKFTANGDFLWARVISGPAEDMARGVVADHLGNVYVVGHFTDTVTFSVSPSNTIAARSAGGQDVFVVKYAPNGQLLWHLTGGGTGDDTATDIDKYRWSGKLYVSGGFENRASFGTASILANGRTDAFLMKMDMDGNAHWIRNGGGLEHDVAASVAVDPTNESVYITGDFYDQANFGSVQLQATGSSDMFLAKYSENGTLQWVRTNGGTTVDVATTVGTDLNGNVFVSGYYQGTTSFQGFSATALSYNDVFLSKFDGDGNCLWLRSAGSWGLDNCLGMAVGWDGSTFLTGFFEEEMFAGTGSFVGNGYDIFVLSYNPDGSLRYGRNAGAGSSDFGTAVCLGPDQSLYITGYYFFFADFDAVTIGNAENGDCFLARMTDILSVQEPTTQDAHPDCFVYNGWRRTMVNHCTDVSFWSVSNALGQVVLEGRTAQTEIDLSSLPTGYYTFSAYGSALQTSTGFVVP